MINIKKFISLILVASLSVSALPMNIYADDGGSDDIFGTIGDWFGQAVDNTVNFATDTWNNTADLATQAWEGVSGFSIDIWNNH